MLLSILLAAAASAGVTITLPAEAKVRGTEVELGELCLVAGLDGELVERVRALELGYSPAPGFSRILTAERIRSELARAIPGIEVRVAGERACRVWPEIKEVDPAVLESTARAELIRAYAGKEATFTLAEPITAVRVPLGEKQNGVLARTSTGELRSGTVGVAVEVLVDGLRYRTLWTSWRVDVWETRPVLNRTVRAGEELGPELFTRKRILLGHASEMPQLDPSESKGAVATHDLQEGQGVSLLDIHRPAAVTLGAMLFLRVRKGPIEARVSALALETGSVGQRIRVKAIDSGQEMVATVTGRDACEITL